jgi:hypothetical protein
MEDVRRYSLLHLSELLPVLRSLGRTIADPGGEHPQVGTELRERWDEQFTMDNLGCQPGIAQYGRDALGGKAIAQLTPCGKATDEDH